MSVSISVSEAKERARVLGKTYRAGLSAEEKRRKDSEILRKFLETAEYRRCTAVFSYLSLPSEIDTAELICRAWRDGKQVALPRCVPGSRELEFYWVTDWNELKKGPFGLREPSPDRCALAATDSATLCVVPGLCFDEMGYRVGYGKGYYDRFLEKFPGTAVGFCYADCICKKVPKDSYDRSVSAIVTEFGILRKQDIQNREMEKEE